jgi:hypothetical protein
MIAAAALTTAPARVHLAAAHSASARMHLASARVHLAAAHLASARVHVAAAHLASARVHVAAAHFASAHVRVAPAHFTSAHVHVTAVMSVTPTAAAPTPTVPAFPAAVTQAFAIGLAAPVKAGTMPAVVVKAVIPAAEEELRLLNRHQLEERMGGHHAVCNPRFRRAGERQQGRSGQRQAKN